MNYDDWKAWDRAGDEAEAEQRLREREREEADERDALIEQQAQLDASAPEVELCTECGGSGEGPCLLGEDWYRCAHCDGSGKEPA